MQRFTLSLLLLLSAVCGHALSFTVGDFRFTNDIDTWGLSYPVPGDGSVFVSGYTGSDEWVEIPASVDYDGQTYHVTGVAGFYNQNVRHVSLPLSVKIIYCGAFQSCSRLEEIDLTNCTVILPGAFHDCRNLSRVILPSEINYQFYGSPFSDCPQLKLELPSYSSAFREVDGAIIWNGNKVIYYSRDAVGEVTVADDMLIDDCAFQYCSGITGLVLPSIGESAVDSHLRSPFQGCDALKTVRFTGEAGYGFGYDITEDILLKVPRGSSEGYRNIFYDGNIEEYGYNVKCNYSSGCRIFNAGTGEELYFDRLIDLENPTIRIEPAAGYEIESLKVGDTDVTDRLTGELTFSFLDRDKEVGVLTINLRQLPSLRMSYFPAALKVYVNGVKVSPYDVICSGEDFSLLILPSDVYTVSSVSVDYKSYQLPEPYETLTIKNNGAMQTVYINYRSRSSLYTQLSGHGTGTIVVNGQVQTSGTLTSYGDRFDLYFIPGEGSYLSRVLLGSEDVTASISGNHYSCPAGRRVYAYFEPEETPAVATLTIKGVGQHMTRHTYTEGQQAIVEIIPEDNWTIESVSLNGEDASAMLSDHTVTIPAIAGDNTLDVVMSHYSGVGENSVADSAVSVICRHTEIEVTGLADSDRVEVFNAGGTRLYSGTGRIIPLSPGEVYIVTTPVKSFKVML